MKRASDAVAAVLENHTLADLIAEPVKPRRKRAPKEAAD